MKPILFNTEMVKAILDGRKTVTRRAINIDIVNRCDIDHDGTLLCYENCDGDHIDNLRMCRYRTGDILYVRETWHKYTKRVGNGEACHLHEFYGYKASIANSEDANEKWKPSIFMPKEVARIFLKVTDVRIEKLQDITEEQAKAEGAKSVIHPDFGEVITAKEFFEYIWNDTIKKDQIKYYGWEANPYVWVIEFEVIPKGSSIKEE